jgi:hypothetical protein
MLKRTFRFMSFGVVFGFVWLFLFTNAVAQLSHCNATLYPDDLGRIQRGECFENNGYVVEIIPDGSGNFPQINNGNSVFKYMVTNIGGKLVSKADILVPICQPVNFNDPTNLKVISSSPSGTFYGPPNYSVGFGDPNTGFGLGLTTVSTWVWNGAVGTLSITLAGKVLASPNAMLLNRGTANYAYGQILAPCCGIIGNQDFPPEVPRTTMKEMTIEGINVCVESTDESGCPTKIYSCAYDTVSPCGCAATDQVLWTKSTIKDLGVSVGRLRQTWIENNPRCPMTFLSLEGSCSQAGLTNNGYAYQSGSYSSIEGTVYGPTGAALPNVYMKACTNGVPPCNQIFKTNSSGKYKICIPTLITFPPSTCSGTKWKGTVTPIPPSGATYTFGINDYLTSGVCGTVQNQNFTATPN